MLRSIGQSLWESAQIRIFGTAEHTVRNEEGVTYKVRTYSRKEFNKMCVDHFNQDVQEIERSLKEKTIKPKRKDAE